jgi:hypothetical protein
MEKLAAHEYALSFDKDEIIDTGADRVLGASGC